MAVFDLSDDSVVVVVGSGAGGGTLSNELAQKGIDVVCLEAGPRLDAGRHRQRLRRDVQPAQLARQARRHGRSQPRRCRCGYARRWAARRCTGPARRCASRSTSGRRAPITATSPAPTCSTGRPMAPRWRATTTRPRRRSASPAPATGRGCPATTTSRCWPTAPRCSATRRSTPATWASTRSSAMAGRRVSSSASAWPGCAIGAKWSTLYTEVPKAEATGHFELRPESMALQIQHDASGKVTGVLYADKDGNQQVQKARAVCVAGNSVESPRLLLNSASSKFPDGLANSSGQVGRNFMRHTTGAVYGIMPGPVHLDRGTPDGRDHHGRVPPRSGARLRRRLRDGDAARVRPRRSSRRT